MVSTFSVKAQENFLERNLVILQKISFRTSYETVKDCDELKNYPFQKEYEDEISLANDTNLKVINILLNGNDNIMIQLEKKNKVFLAVSTRMAAVQTVFIKSELEYKNFKIIKEDETAKIWSKSSYKYQIVTDSSDSKIHSLLFVSPNHPDFVK